MNLITVAWHCWQILHRRLWTQSLHYTKLIYVVLTPVNLKSNIDPNTLGLNFEVSGVNWPSSTL